MSTKPRTPPSTFFEEACRKAGATVRLAWEEKGPRNTSIAWHSCYIVNGHAAIVQTYTDGDGWNVFTPCNSHVIHDTLIDAFKRLGVMPPKEDAA